MTRKGYFAPTQTGLSEVQTLTITSDGTWWNCEDATLLKKLSRAIHNELARQSKGLSGVLDAPEFFDIQGWRRADNAYTGFGLRPVARGSWGRNYETLREANRVEVKVKVRYPVPATVQTMRGV